MPEAKPVHTAARIEGATDMRIATAPVNWNNFDLPEWRPTVPFPKILDLMSEAGYRSTEYDRSFGTDPELLLEAVRRDCVESSQYGLAGNEGVAGEVRPKLPGPAVVERFHESERRGGTTTVFTRTRSRTRLERVQLVDDTTLPGSLDDAIQTDPSVAVIPIVCS